MSEVKPILDQNAFRFDSALPDKLQLLTQARQRTIGPASMLFYREPLEIVRGEGAWLYDADGRQYLDAYNNVPVLGHCHPRVVAAVSGQLATLNTHTRYLDRKIHHYVHDLLGTLQIPEARAVFTCSGSEANDVALRLAQMFTGRQGVIVSTAAYHGNTSLVSQVSPSAFREGGLPDWVVSVDPPLLQVRNENAAQHFCARVTEAIRTLETRSYGCSALLVDTIFSSDGVCADPPGFLLPAVEAVRAVGGLFIADEVQPGFGRTGDTFWGFQRHRLTPDIVTMGKPMGNGYPIAAVVACEALFCSMTTKFGYFNTFGGSNAAIAAAQTVLDVIREEGLQQLAAATGQRLRNDLQALAARFATIGPIRGAGLYLGIDIVEPDKPGLPSASRATEIVNAMRDAGVLIGAAGQFGHTLKIRPPLCFGSAHAERLVETLEQVLRQQEK